MSTTATAKLAPKDPRLPTQIDLIAAICKKFGKRAATPRQMNVIIEAANSILAAFANPPVMATDGMGLTKWLASDDVGMSSKYMASVLAPTPWQQEFRYPHDPDDFGRCYRLLRAVPELRANSMRLAQCPAPWPQLHAEWLKLEALYEQELPANRAPKLYDEMKRIFKEAGVP